jgi:hypothetical protein
MNTVYDYENFTIPHNYEEFNYHPPTSYHEYICQPVNPFVKSFRFYVNVQSIELINAINNKIKTWDDGLTYSWTGIVNLNELVVIESCAKRGSENIIVTDLDISLSELTNKLLVNSLNIFDPTSIIEHFIMGYRYDINSFDTGKETLDINSITETESESEVLSNSSIKNENTSEEISFDQLNQTLSLDMKTGFDQAHFFNLVNQYFNHNISNNDFIRDLIVVNIQLPNTQLDPSKNKKLFKKMLSCDSLTKLLIDNKIPIASDKKLIHWVCMYSSIPMIHHIFDKSTPEELNDNSNVHKLAPIHLICMYQWNTSLIKWVFERELNKEIQTKHGYRPIHLIFKHQTNPSLIKWIIKSGIELNILDYEGYGLMECFLSSTNASNFEIFQLLVSKNISLNSTDPMNPNKWSPFHFALMNGSVEIIHYMCVLSNELITRSGLTQYSNEQLLNENINLSKYVRPRITKMVQSVGK